MLTFLKAYMLNWASTYIIKINFLNNRLKFYDDYEINTCKIKNFKNKSEKLLKLLV